MVVKYYSRRKLDRIISNYIADSNSILDIGCGIRPQTFITPKNHVCLDPHKEYLEYLKKSDLKKGIINRTYINKTWDAHIAEIPEKSYDIVFLLDVIEHLEKESAKNLLSKTENVAKKQIIIFTPLGFLPQKHQDDTDAWGLSGAKWQEHKSGWTVDDFDERWLLLVTKKYHSKDSFQQSTVLSIKNNA